jgi:hypothetical protein
LHHTASSYAWSPAKLLAAVNGRGDEAHRDISFTRDVSYEGRMMQGNFLREKSVENTLSWQFAMLL